MIRSRLIIDFVHKRRKSATGHFEQCDVNMASKSVLSLFSHSDLSSTKIASAGIPTTHSQEYDRESSKITSKLLEGLV